MVTFVVVHNFVLGLVCLFVARKIWQLRRKLARASEAMLLAERAIHRTLYRAPEFIQKGQVGTHRLRRAYQQLGLNVEKIEQILSIINFSQSLWQRRRILMHRTKATRRTTGKPL